MNDAVVYDYVGFDDLGQYRAIVMFRVAEQSAALNLI